MRACQKCTQGTVTNLMSPQHLCWSRSHHITSLPKVLRFDHIPGNHSCAQFDLDSDITYVPAIHMYKFAASVPIHICA